MRTRTLTGACFVGLLGTVYFCMAPFYFSLLLGLMLAYILVFEWAGLHAWFLTPVYPVLPFLIVIMLNQGSQRWWVLVIFVLSMSCDTGAYLVGSWWGRRPLAPRISPKKTWEGFWGGLLTAELVLGGVWYFGGFPVPGLFFFGYVFLGSWVALFGDLLISLLKRRSHLKDTGVLLPGHGGLLDRVDSILAVALYTLPFTWFW